MANVLGADPLERQIADMKANQDRMRAERRRIAAELKVAEKKKSRLRKRAKLLTDEDLVQVLMMRKAARTTGDVAPNAEPFASEDGNPEESSPVADGSASGSGLADEQRL